MKLSEIINNYNSNDSPCSKKPYTIVSFRLNEEQYQYLQKIANRMYQKGLIKSSNIGALAKIITLYVGQTYPDIEKQLAKRQRKVTKKMGWLKRLLVNDRDDDFP
jgi:hypothetical protein